MYAIFTGGNSNDDDMSQQCDNFHLLGDEDRVQQNESGGLHVFEFHLGTLGHTAGFMVVMGIVALIVYWCMKHHSARRELRELRGEYGRRPWDTPPTYEECVPRARRSRPHACADGPRACRSRTGSRPRRVSRTLEEGLLAREPRARSTPRRTATLPWGTAASVDDSAISYSREGDDGRVEGLTKSTSMPELSEFWENTEVDDAASDSGSLMFRLAQGVGRVMYGH